MILYSWTAFSEGAREGAPPEVVVSERSPGLPVAMGITDDLARAMQAGEEALGSGKAAVVFIEAVRPGITAHTLAPCYAHTGVGWLGRRTQPGGVSWDRFFSRADPEACRVPGRMGP